MLYCDCVLLHLLRKVKMQTRYMERSNSMAREKRGLDSASAEEGQPDRKRPALARCLVFFGKLLVFLFSSKFW